MRTATITIGLFALALTTMGALAQTSSSSGTTSPGTSVGRGAPALGSTPSGPVTPNRSNTDIFPPSRLLPPTQGSTGTQTPAGGSTLDSPGAGTATTTTSTPGTPGAASTADTPGSTTQSGASSPKQDGSTTATTSDGQQGTGGAPTTGSKRPIPPNSQTSSGGGGTATRTGKNSSNETVADCMKLWEPTTHMTKADWSRTCRRVQGRLDQVTKQIMTK